MNTKSIKQQQKLNSECCIIVSVASAHNNNAVIEVIQKHFKFNGTFSLDKISLFSILTCRYPSVSSLYDEFEAYIYLLNNSYTIAIQNDHQYPSPTVQTYIQHNGLHNTFVGLISSTQNEND